MSACKINIINDLDFYMQQNLSQDSDRFTQNLDESCKGITEDGTLVGRSDRRTRPIEIDQPNCGTNGHPQQTDRNAVKQNKKSSSHQFVICNCKVFY